MTIIRCHTSVDKKKEMGIGLRLHARQPINTDCAACGVTPELDELLDGEDAGQVLDRSAILSVAAFELVVSSWVAGDPADVSNADNVAVQISLKNTCAASGGASVIAVRCGSIIGSEFTVSSGLDLGGFLKVLSMGVHLSQHCADPVVLHAQLLYPLLVVGTCLVRDGHVLELSFLGEVDVVHGGCLASRPRAISCDLFVVPVELPLGLKLSSLSNDVTRSRLLLYQLLAVKASLEWK